MTDAPPPAAPAPFSESDERLWSSLAHAGTIFFGFVPALIIWLTQKEKSAFVETESKEALNFGILITALYFLGWLTTFVFVGFLIIPLAWILSLIFCIQAAIKTNKGESYRYPLNVRLIK